MAIFLSSYSSFQTQSVNFILHIKEEFWYSCQSFFINLSNVRFAIRDTTIVMVIVKSGVNLKMYKTFTTKHILSEKLVHNVNSSFKCKINAKDAFIIGVCISWFLNVLNN